MTCTIKLEQEIFLWYLRMINLLEYAFVIYEMISHLLRPTTICNMQRKMNAWTNCLLKVAEYL